MNSIEQEMRTAGRVRRACFLAADAALGLVFLAQVVLFWGSGKEDAYICYRYARNFARGLGLVYNAGEYVEGFSNLPWTLSLAILHRLGLPLEAGVHFMSLFYAALAFLALRWACRRYFGAETWAARLPLLLLTCLTSIPGSFGNGLEGSAVLFAATLALAGLAGCNAPLTALGAALLAANRPEGFLFAGVLVLWSAYAARRGDWSWKAAFGVVIVAVLTVMALTLFRCWYYGDYIPNSVRAKGGGLLDAGFRRVGTEYLFDYARHIGSRLLLLACCALLPRRRRDLAIALIGLLALNAAVVWLHGGDWMVHYRLLVPFFPVLVFLVAMAVAALAAKRRILGAAAGVLCLFCGARLIEYDELRRMASILDWSLARIWQEPFDVQWHLGPYFSLDDFKKPDDQVLVESGGVQGYMLDGVRVLEMNGLTNREVITARSPYAYGRPATGTLDWPALFAQHPTYLLLNPLSTFYYINDIARIPELCGQLDQYVVVQRGPAEDGFRLIDLLLVRHDRATLGKFLRRYGSIAPAADYLGEVYAVNYILPIIEPATGLQRDGLLRTSWQQDVWRRVPDGEPFCTAWQDWSGTPRVSARLPIAPGENVFIHALPDDAPLVGVIGVHPDLDPQTFLRAAYADQQGQTHDVPLPGLQRDTDGALALHLWAIRAWEDGPPAQLTLTFEAKQAGELLLAVHRWCRASVPDPL